MDTVEQKPNEKHSDQKNMPDSVKPPLIHLHVQTDVTKIRQRQENQRIESKMREGAICECTCMACDAFNCVFKVECEGGLIAVES